MRGTVYIGIDPGFSGAIAVIRGNVAQVYDTPTVRVSAPPKKGKKRTRLELDTDGLAGIFTAIPVTPEGHVLYIEHASVMPHQGVVSSGRYMQSFGYMLGLAQGLGFNPILVRPQTWKKALGLDSDKAKSIELAKQLYPDANLKRKRHDDHNRAEALLITHYAKITYGKESS